MPGPAYWSDEHEKSINRNFAVNFWTNNYRGKNQERYTCIKSDPRYHQWETRKTTYFWGRRWWLEHWANYVILNDTKSDMQVAWQKLNHKSRWLARYRQSPAVSLNHWWKAHQITRSIWTSSSVIPLDWTIRTELRRSLLQVLTSRP